MTSDILLTIIIPCYNEKNTIEEIVQRVNEINFNKEIILVDDCSIDGSREIIMSKLKNKVEKVILHNSNLGKGAAIISASKFINGDIVIIQDADLEYDPSEYSKLVEPIIKKQYEVVYGSRALMKENFKKKLTFHQWYRVLGNKVLTIFSNFINNQKLTDAHTCYKVFNSKVFKELNLVSKDFTFCPEVTTKISKKKIKIYEVPITYNGRSYSEGKKIKHKDFFLAIYSLIRFRYFSNK